MNTFQECLQDLMEENGTNIQKLSKELKIYDSVFYDYLQGAMPDIKYAVILANYFNCSISYLVGLDAEPKYTDFKNTFDINLFIPRYLKLLEERNVSNFKVCKESGLNFSSLYAWKNGSEPNMNSLILIARYFDCSIDYLIGRNNNI